MPSVEYLSCVRALPQRLHLRVPILGNAVGDDLLRDPLEVRLLSTAKLSPAMTTALPRSILHHRANESIFLLRPHRTERRRRCGVITTARPSSRSLQAWSRRHRLEAEGLGLSFRPLPRLA